MNIFEALFGIKEHEVQKNCVLMPLLPPGILGVLKVKKLFRGKLYGAGNAPDFTLIHTGVGAALVGDALLYLKDTPCKNVILFGSCGLVQEKKEKGLSIASLVVPECCFAFESFSDMLLGGELKQQSFYANSQLLDKFLAYQKSGYAKVTCATVASLKLEEEMLGRFIAQGIDVVDMECSAFFSAASCCGFRALALFYVTDIIKKKPFYADLGPLLRVHIISSCRNAANILCGFIQQEKV